MMMAQIREIRAEPPLFQPPLEQIVDVIVRERPRLVFLCNPNNPTGQCLEPSEIQRLIEACDSRTYLILDEAYKTFVTGQFFSGLPSDHSLILRSMTKDFAIAGLRLGYVVADTGLIEQLKGYQPAWSVNALAQAAGLAALSEINYYLETLTQLSQLSKEFYAQIESRGYEFVHSQVHFGIIHLKQSAKNFRTRLLPLSIQVRDCTSFGLPEYIRVSTRLQNENQKLLDVLDLWREYLSLPDYENGNQRGFGKKRFALNHLFCNEI
jgi:histidinol-phosphate/aromatic aminotransferase/cobyric acid decarboxylase-like protein